MVEIIQQIRHESGIPLGGIGAGSVEIRPDGLFHEWQILNAGQWSPNSPCACREAISPRPEDLLYFVRIRTADGNTVVRCLALDKSLHDLYAFSWIRSVERIRFNGRFPIAALAYEDPDIPVRIRAEVFSPFVPHDSRVSGTPGFYVRFVIRNLTDQEVEVSLLGHMMNLAGLGQEGREPRNRLERDEKTATVVFSADGLKEGECTTGDLAFSITGENLSWISGAFRADRGRHWVESCYGLKLYSFLLPFRETGELPKLEAEGPPRLSEDLTASTLAHDKKRELLRELVRHSFIRRKLETIRSAVPDLEENEEELDRFLDDLALNFKGRWPLLAQEWGAAALCSRMTLPPGAERDVLFTVSWHFPNHLSQTGEKIGHAYENWFGGALEVSRFLVSNYPKIRAKAILLPEMLYNSSLDEVTADAVSAQLSTLIKCTWWTKDNLFGVWEGLGCCGFHTTDITYQGSFPIIALFPDLQKIQMKHGAKFQREDGRVHHLFQPDLSAVDNDFARVDMNPQFVMLAARDYQWTGDRDYLETLWPHIVKAMESTALLDKDGDGLPDSDTRRNTYDAWDFSGCPAYIASLWLGALKAAIRLAKEMKDGKHGKLWSGIYERGVKAFDELLWNGSYYVLWKDPHTGRVDECCMSDQMSGDWFCSVMGWGSILNPERIRRALTSIVQHNFIPDRGLINASYPPGTQPRAPTVANIQAEATWTGIEYTVASLLIEHGMLDEAMKIVRDIHDRHFRAGRLWNHNECGDHYYRALSSWSVLLSISGFRWDASAKEMTFASMMKNVECVFPFFVPGVAGLCAQRSSTSERSVEVKVLSGSLSVCRLRFPGLGFGTEASVSINEEEHGRRIEGDGGIILVPETILREGDRFVVRQETQKNEEA